MNIDDKDMTKGLYQKFLVRRTDGSDLFYGKHARCEYFVLDLHHDPFARFALDAYLLACEHAYPELAKDLRLKRDQNEALTAARLEALRAAGAKIPMPLGEAIVRAIRTINSYHNLGDAIYAVRERAANDQGFEGNTWEHPAVQEYNAAVQLLQEHGVIT